MLGPVLNASGESPERSVSGRRRLIVIGPTPPPIHGVAFATVHVLEGVRRAGALAAHVETGDDPRPVVTTGRFDLTNVWLGLKHSVALVRMLARHRKADVYLPISQGRWGFLRDAAFIALARLARRQVIVHLHGGLFRDFYRDSGPLLRALIRGALRGVAQAWVLTPAHADIFDGLVPPARVRVLENTAEDMAALAGDPPARRHGGTEVRILYLSNLIAEKGCLDLIEAVERLGADAEGLHLRMVGEVEDDVARELSERAGRLEDIGARVEVAGVRFGDEKAREYLWADVFVLPSRYPPEGQPLVLLEAMSAGLPIVSTDHSGIPHTVRHEREGLIVPRGDIEAIAAAIERLRADGELRERLGRRARVRYETAYRPESFYGRIAELLAAG